LPIPILLCACWNRAYLVMALPRAMAVGRFARKPARNASVVMDRRRVYWITGRA